MINLWLFFYSETVYSYLTQVKELEETVIRMICESFELEKYSNSLVESTDYILRLMKYSAPNTEENSIGLIQHQDKSFLTVLSENHVHGLEFETKDGEWLRAELSPSSFIVLVGEHLKVSNKKIWDYVLCCCCDLIMFFYQGVEQ